MKKLILSAIIIFIAATSFGQWSLTGNAGTTTSNFIGTTDAQSLRFRIRNVPSGIIDSVNSNTAFGYASFRSLSGFRNTAFGCKSLFSNTSGTNNTAIGINTLLLNTTGSINTAIGSQALSSNTTGNNNTAIGRETLFSNTTGNDNTAIGSLALFYNTTGIANTAIGTALRYNTTGIANTAIGSLALASNSTGSFNTALGCNADVSISSNISNATAIGNGAYIDSSNKVRIGNGYVTSIGGKVAWTSFSDGRIKKNIKSDVPGLNFVKLLRPVTYNYDVKKQYALEGRTDNTENYEGKDDIEKISFSGFIAQEVDEAAKKIGYSFSGVDKSGKIMGLRYSDFVVPVVKSVQELAIQNEDLKNENQIQKNENQIQKNEIEELKKENEAIKDRLEKVEQLITKYMGNNPNTNIKLQLASLEQNNPNPFNGNTTIGYTLPKNNSGAAINFYAQNGALVKSVKVTGEGRNTITLNRNELAAGIYNYVLVLNGKPADSKQMKID